MRNFLEFIKNNKVRLFPVVVLILLGLVTFFTLILVKTRQELRKKAALVDTGELTFANLNPTTVNPGQTFTVAINMSSGGPNVVGADILVQFDKNKLTLESLTKNTTPANPYKTYAPVDASGNFDTVTVISKANNTTSGGIVEFGMVAFDWGGSVLTSPTTSLLNVSTLTFKVKTGASGSTILSFVNNGTSSTTDSNIVVNPVGGGDPEDILKAAPYTNSQVSVTISGPAGSPSPTPSTQPSASPSSYPSPTTGTCNTCYNFDGTTDGKIGLADILYIANRYGLAPGNPNYAVVYDVFGSPCPDNTINIGDILMVANRYGLTSCKP